MGQVVSEEVVNGAMVLGPVELTQLFTLISESALAQSDQSSRWSGLQQQELPYQQHLHTPSSD